jgi:hypothetical protein
MRYLPEAINELAGTASVSTLTVLKAFTNLGSDYHTLLFVVINTDDTDTVTVTIETSEDGVHPDGTSIWTLTAAPGKQASMEVGPGLLRRYWRMSANTDSPGFPTAAVTWCIRGVNRKV